MGAAAATISVIVCLFCFVNGQTAFNPWNFVKNLFSAPEKSRLGRATDNFPVPIISQEVSYQDPKTGTPLTGYLAYNPALQGRPRILVVHNWNGRDEFENGKAADLARLGYVGFALDVYGAVGRNAGENIHLIQPFMSNRTMLMRRLQLGLDTLRRLELNGGTDEYGAIGFCFGGLAVLDMARANFPLRGVASFHGNLTPLPTNSTANQGNVTSKVLVMTGHDDPSIPPTMIDAFKQEMTSRHADWQTIVYSNTVHGFTRKPVNGEKDQSYNPVSDRRSWESMKYFFKEIFNEL